MEDIIAREGAREGKSLIEIRSRIESLSRKYAEGLA